MSEDRILEILKSYQKDPPYGDCRLRCFSQITGIYGQRIREEELFGLGYGLMLRTEMATYKGVLLPVLVGRTEEAEINALERVGYAIEKKSYSKEALAQVEPDPEIMDRLREKVPVLFECNVKQLPYIHKSHLDDNTRHLVILFGYEEKTKEVTLLDGLTNTIESIPLSTLITAHTQLGNEERKPSWYRVRPPEEAVIVEDDTYLRSLVDLNEHYKSYQPNREEFVSFLKQFQVSVLTEKKKDYVRLLVYLNCIFVRKMEEIHGTFYRTIYRQYLEKLNNHVLSLEKEIAAFSHLEAQWKRISFRLRYKNKDILLSMNEFVAILEAIMQEEEALLEELAEKAKKGC